MPAAAHLPAGEQARVRRCVTEPTCPPTGGALADPASGGDLPHRATRRQQHQPGRLGIGSPCAASSARLEDGQRTRAGARCPSGPPLLRRQAARDPVGNPGQRLVQALRPDRALRADGLRHRDLGLEYRARLGRREEHLGIGVAARRGRPPLVRRSSDTCRVVGALRQRDRGLLDGREEVRHHAG